LTSLRLLLLLAAAATLLGGCGGSSASKYSTSSPESELAQIDLKTPLPTDAQVAPYATVLDQLQQDCTNPRRELADYATAIHQRVASASTLHILRLALTLTQQAVAKGAVRSDCKETFAAAGVAASGGG
jgi:hypothetical protein